MIDVLVVYDVRTDTPQGQKRLRRVARICEGLGNRVQYSVFELHCEEAQLITFMHHIQAVIDPDDSIRIYRVPNGVLAGVTQLGRQRPQQPSGAVVF